MAYTPGGAVGGLMGMSNSYNNPAGNMQSNLSTQMLSNLLAYQQANAPLQGASNIAGVLGNQIFPAMLNATPELSTIGAQYNAMLRRVGTQPAAPSLGTPVSTAGFSSASNSQAQRIQEAMAGALADAQLKSQMGVAQLFPGFASGAAALSQATPQMGVAPQTDAATRQAIQQALALQQPGQAYNRWSPMTGYGV